MKKIVLSEEEIDQICRKIAAEMTEKLKDEERIPLVIGVMKGAINFMAGILKYMTRPIFTDYIQITSYFGTQRTNNVRMIKDVSYDCSNRTVIVVEDIVDTGHSMRFLIDHLLRHNAKKVYVCALIDKKVAREVEVPIDFCGYVMKEKQFVAGFGLDYHELERNVPYIYEVDEDDLKRMDGVLEKDHFTFHHY